MEKWAVLAAFDLSGFSKLETFLNGLVKDEGLLAKFGFITLLLPPNLFEVDDYSSLQDGLYCWTSINTDVIKQFILSLQIIIQDSEKRFQILDDAAAELLSDCTHQLADELPNSGSCITQLYFFHEEMKLRSIPLCLMGALKRLEIWHQCVFFSVATENTVDSYSSRIELDKYIRFNGLSIQDAILQFKSPSLWSGHLSLIMRKRSGELHLDYYCLYQAEEKMLLDDNDDVISEVSAYNRLLRDGKSGVVFDNCIQLVSVVKQENMPLHLVCPIKYLLNKVPALRENPIADLLDYCPENSWYLAFLKYGYNIRKDTKLSTTAWNEHITDQFTQCLSLPYSRQELRNHVAMFLKKTSAGVVSVYFVRCMEDINSNAVLELLKAENELNVENEDYPDEVAGEKDYNFYKSAVDIIPDQEWCEKAAWKLAENALKVGKSISRCKSDDFKLKGLEVTIADVNKPGGTLHESFSDVLSLFSKYGRPRIKNFQPIRIVQDRLLKNIKPEDTIKDLPYENAEKLIGHGIDYCVDSLCAVRLDNRLVKVQKRFIPEDTITMTSYRAKVLTEESLPIRRESSEHKNKPVKQYLVSDKSEEVAVSKRPNVPGVSKRESRSQRHFRRMQTLIDGVVLKYGGVEETDPKYRECCKRLFNKCVPVVKKFTSSKGLNDKIKELAKGLVLEVVDSVK